MPSLGGTMRDRYGATLRGTMVDVAVANPAAGKDWSYTLPGGYSYRWVLGYAKFKTGAENLGQQLGVRILDGDQHSRCCVMSGIAPGINQTREVGYALGLATGPESTFLGAGIPLPDVWLPGGWTIKSFSGPLGVADQYSEVRLWLAQAYDPEPGEAAGELLQPPLTWDEIGVLHAT